MKKTMVQWKEGIGIITKRQQMMACLSLSSITQPSSPLYFPLSKTIRRITHHLPSISNKINHCNNHNQQPPPQSTTK